MANEYNPQSLKTIFDSTQDPDLKERLGRRYGFIADTPAVQPPLAAATNEGVTATVPSADNIIKSMEQSGAFNVAPQEGAFNTEKANTIKAMQQAGAFNLNAEQPGFQQTGEARLPVENPELATSLSTSPLSSRLMQGETTTVKERQIESPQAVAAMQNARNAVREAVIAESDAKKAESAAKISAAEAELIRQQRDINEMRSFEDIRRTEIDARRAKLDKAIEDKSSLEINPNRFYDEKGVLGKVGLAVAVGLGGYAAGMLGGENTALKIIERAVDQDIAAQKAKIAQAGEKTSDLRTSYADAMTEFNNERIARSQMQREALGVFRRGLEIQMEKNVGNQLAQASLQKQLAALQAEDAKLQMEIGKEVERTTTVQRPVVQQLTEFEKQAAEADVKSFTELKKKVQSSRDLVSTVDQAMKETATGGALTGPIVGRLTPTLREESQKLESLYSNVNIDTLVGKFSGMSQLANSNAERAAFEKGQPSMNLDPKTNYGILLGIKVSNAKAAAEAKAQEAYLRKNGSLVGYTSEFADRKVDTLISPKGEVKIVPAKSIDTLRKTGYKSPDDYVESVFKSK